MVVLTTAFVGSAGFVASAGYFGGVNVVELYWERGRMKWGFEQWGIAGLWGVVGCIGAVVQFWMIGGGWKKWRERKERKKKVNKEVGELEEERKRLVGKNVES